MLKIMVVGGNETDVEVSDTTVKNFCHSLGKEIIRQGHILITGCRSELDHEVSKGADEELRSQSASQDQQEIEKRLISYVLEGQEPSHEFGTVLRSRLTSWDPADGLDLIPEPIEKADVIILIQGSDWIKRASHWAEFTKKPVLPVAYFGGAAREIFYKECDKFDQKYSGRLEKIDYEMLNQVVPDDNWSQQVDKIVNLAEKISTSKSVVVIMSYSQESEAKIEFDNLYGSFELACKDYEYECLRVEDLNTVGRIIPTILDKIEKAGFVIADLTELKQNVFYELGFAEGLKKTVIVTAKENTELPFDVADIPTIFWKSIDLQKLRQDLKIKIEAIAKSQGRTQ